MEEKLKCSKCGSENLQFVSFTKSEKDTSALFITIAILCAFSILWLVWGFASAWNMETNGEITGLVYKAYIGIIMGSLVLNTLNLGIMCYAFLKMLPYKTTSEIHVVCSCCGHHESVEKLLEAKNIDKNANSNFCK